MAEFMPRNGVWIKGTRVVVVTLSVAVVANELTP